jgi:hypothetical protein
MPFTPSLATPIFIVAGLFGDDGALGIFGDNGVAGLDRALGVFLATKES